LKSTVVDAFQGFYFYRYCSAVYMQEFHIIMKIINGERTAYYLKAAGSFSGGAV
jgi:hypothetical protein